MHFCILNATFDGTLYARRLFLFQGNIAIWKLPQLLFQYGGYIERHPSFMEGALHMRRNIIMHKLLFFLARVDISLDWSLYDVADFHTLLWKKPLWFQMTYLGSGNSSYQVENSIIDANRKVLASMKRIIVCVDNKTRKPRNVAHSIIPEKFKYKAVEKLDVINRFVPPATGVFESCFTVNFSDIDGNQHTNMAVYLRYCMDCAVMASRAGKLKRFTANLDTYRVRNIYSKYIRESRVGDKVLVKGWEDEQHSDQLCFVVYRDGTALNESAIRLYINPLSKM